MAHELGALGIIKGLVDRDGLPDEVIGRERDLHHGGAVGGTRREGLLHGDGLAVLAGDRVTGLGVVELGHEPVVPAGDHVAVGDAVGHGHAADGQVAVAIGGVIGGGVDLGLRVVQGAQVDDLGVAGNREGGGDQRIALVARAAQLLDGVGVVGEGTLGVCG